MYKLSLIKLWRKRGFFLLLTISLTLLFTVICTVPMFSFALQSRMLRMSFDKQTETSGEYADRVTYRLPMETLEQQKEYANWVENGLIRQFAQKNVSFTAYYRSVTFRLTDTTYRAEEAEQVEDVPFLSLNTYEPNLRLTAGRLPEASADADGCVEAMVSLDTAVEKGLTLGHTYAADKAYNGSEETFSVKIVGVYRVLRGGRSGLTEDREITDCLICDPAMFQKQFAEKNCLKEAKWDYMLDYTQLPVERLGTIQKACREQTEAFRLAGEFTYSGTEVIDGFSENNRSLVFSMLIYAVPMLLLLLYTVLFLCMLTVRSDRKEILLLQSRGASRGQICLLYLIQDVLLSLVPAAAAPFLARLLCRVIGQTTGFLEFGPNIPLNGVVSATVILTDCLAFVLVVGLLLLPPILLFTVSAGRKRRANPKGAHTPFWKKAWLDLVLLAAGGYGYYAFLSRQELMKGQTSLSQENAMDPVTFLITMLFLFGGSLLFIRLYTLFLQLVIRAGKSRWGAGAYYALQMAHRMGTREQFAVILAVVSIALGLFSANSSRSINRNTEDISQYSAGADVWIKTQPTNSGDEDTKQEVRPPLYAHICEGTEATRIALADQVQIYADREQSRDPITFMGVDPAGFSRVAWSRSDMLDEPFASYLNKLRGLNCLITQSLAEKMALHVGDSFGVNINGKGSEAFDLTVVGIVSAWPGYTAETDEDGTTYMPDRIIVNESLLIQKYTFLTYEIWMKADDSVSLETILSSYAEHGIRLSEVRDHREELKTARNSAYRQSLNAMLTLNALVIFALCFLGIGTYGLSSVTSRISQFGTLRAMGMPQKRVRGTLLLEQGLLTGIPGLFAVWFGGGMSHWLLPIMKPSVWYQSPYLPFHLFASQRDYVMVYLWLAALLLTVCIVQSVVLRRLRISTAIRMGGGE